MSRLKDLIGQKFGRLTVLERAKNDKQGRARWKCRCTCGNICIVRSTNLLSDHSASCGCLHKGVNQKHGMRHTKIYNVWFNIKRRCFNPNNPRYKDYGGRGITICAEWENDFLAFYNYVSKLEHYGEEGYTLDRIDNNGDYEPNNVRYAGAKMQARNTRKNAIVEYSGEQMTLIEAAEVSGINYRTLCSRYQRGDRGERLFRPVEN